MKAASACVFVIMVTSACGPANPTDLTDPEENPETALGEIGYSKRFDNATVMCGYAKLDSGGGCDATSPKCLCKPEFGSLNTPVGSTGNPSGKVLLISQPRYGKRPDGSYAFDAYAAIKARGNFVGHYVNALNPALTCSACPPKSDGTPSAGCGWKCISGAARANQIVDAENAAYAGYPDAAPSWIALNEAWSLLFADSSNGVGYRTWIRDLTKQLVARNKMPLLWVQEHPQATGPFTLLGEIANYTWFGVEAYVSGPDALANGNCAAPFDSNNYCVKQYQKVRNAVRNSASPAIPYDRLIMTEDFANNCRYKRQDGQTSCPSSGTLQNWARAYLSGSPSTGSWDSIVANRARAVKALPYLGGVSSYGWQDNENGTGSYYRVEFEKSYSAITLP